MKNIIWTLIFLPFLLKGQAYPERHNTSWSDSWISCSISKNPNQLRSDSHWFMMDLGYEYALGESKIWNYNDPDNLNIGIQNYYIDVSQDGTNWTEVGEFNIPIANASSFYQGDLGPNFDKINAKYVLLTAKNNYGGDCVGIAEIKIEVSEPIVSDIDQIAINNKYKVSPNPFSDLIILQSENNLNKARLYKITSINGGIVQEGTIISDESTFEITTKDIPSGVYTIIINEDKQTYSLPIIKN
jgi:hypothetical protein